VIARHQAKVTVTNDAPVEGIDFAFRRGARVTGLVLDADTQQPVADAQVMSLPSEAMAALMAWRDDPAAFPPYVCATRTDAAGKFAVEGVPPGDYTFCAVGKRHLPGESAQFTVELGEPTAEIRIALKQGDVATWSKEQRQGSR